MLSLLPLLPLLRVECGGRHSTALDGGLDRGALRNVPSNGREHVEERIEDLGRLTRLTCGETRRRGAVVSTCTRGGL